MTNLVPIGSGAGLSQTLEDSDDDDVMALLDDFPTSKKKRNQSTTDPSQNQSIKPKLQVRKKA